MLQVFNLDVSKVVLVLQQVFHMHVSSVLSAFRRMLQVLHLDVSKVDRVLHLLPRFLLSTSLSLPPSGASWASAVPTPLS